MKKFSLAVAAFGLTMMVACGDDSSSNASSNAPAKDAAGRTVYTDMKSALSAPCSEANKCEIIILNDPIAQDTLQCNGTNFQSMMGSPLTVCATAESSSDAAQAPAAESSSDAAQAPAVESSSDAAQAPAAESSSDAAQAPAAESSSDAAQTPAAESSSDAAQAPAAESSSDAAQAPGAVETPSGDMVSCEAFIDGTEGEHSCVEIDASSAMAASIKTMCDGMAVTNVPGVMEYTTGTSCNAAATALKCEISGVAAYSLDGKYTTCDDFKAKSMFGAMIGG